VSHVHPFFGKKGWKRIIIVFQHLANDIPTKEMSVYPQIESVSSLGEPSRRTVYNLVNVLDVGVTWMSFEKNLVGFSETLLENIS
jgi:hypothetical protein